MKLTCKISRKTTVFGDVKQVWFKRIIENMRSEQKLKYLLNGILISFTSF